VDYPVSVDEKGVKFIPEKMEKEKLYHCIFKENVLLIYKDSQDILNCYEIEEKELVEKIKNCSDKDRIEKILEDYVERENLKH